MTKNNVFQGKELSLPELSLVSGGDAFSSGFRGFSTGGGTGSALGYGGALMAGLNGARWGLIGGIGGAFAGSLIGIGFYYFS